MKKGSTVLGAIQHRLDLRFQLGPRKGLGQSFQDFRADFIVAFHVIEFGLEDRAIVAGILDDLGCLDEPAHRIET